MIHAFKRGKIASLVVLAIAAAVAVLIWLRDRNYPVFVPVIASALTLALGVVAARLAGNIFANSENTHYLGFLHMELDPRKFIRHYQDVPGRVRGENAAAICRSYLADGYAADGQYEEAIALLKIAPPADNDAVRGLYAANLAGCYLAQGRTEQAVESLAQLREIIDDCPRNKADLARNLTEMLTLHTWHLDCLEGRAVDLEALEYAFDRAQYHLRRLEIAKVAVLAATRAGDDAARKKHLSYLRKNGGMTAYKRWADKQK